jgi:hypothetical protein
MSLRAIDYKSKSLVIYKDGTSVSLKQGAPSPDEVADAQRHRPIAGETPGSIRMAESCQ